MCFPPVPSSGVCSQSGHIWGSAMAQALSQPGTALGSESCFAWQLVPCPASGGKTRGGSQPGELMFLILEMRLEVDETETSLWA